MQTSDHSITVADIECAQLSILRYTQSQIFQREIDFLKRQGCNADHTTRIPKSSSVYRLDPFLSNGLIRVGGRLSKASLPEDMKYPILLPYKSHVTTLIIRSIHEKLGHAGRNHVLTHLLE